MEALRRFSAAKREMAWRCLNKKGALRPSPEKERGLAAPFRPGHSREYVLRIPLLTEQAEQGVGLLVG
ncbi:hypothetical protein, partial [Ferrovibrio sp.]|uniref:hypothetical protein n=1 Tax=Ferrovibrio sp. TaxID=1917215 RepID=UPI001B573590